MQAARNGFCCGHYGIGKILAGLTFLTTDQKYNCRAVPLCDECADGAAFAVARYGDALLAQAVAEVCFEHTGLDFTRGDAQRFIADYLPGPAVKSLKAHAEV